QQGLKVWTLRIGEAAAGEALLQVEGLDHDWDRLIHKVKVEKSARDSRYSTELNGSKYVILIVRDGWGELYLGLNLELLRSDGRWVIIGL
ncbi:hypothetical protein ACLBVR_38525, partial [Pseudomonas aeruginosa]